MNIPEEKSDLCQISLTGVRALTMLGLLAQAPRSLQEIRDKFIALKLINSDNSDDIIRIDMNSLRAMGCEISRSSVKTNHKHELLKHPFGLSITSEEVSLLKRAYKIIKENADLKTLLDYHFLFKKMADFIFNQNIKEQLLGISALKSSNIVQMEQLAEDCKYHNIITIEYKDGGNSKLSTKNIYTEKIAMRNDKIYLFGYEFDTKRPIMYPIKRIVRVLSRKSNENKNYSTSPIEVKFFLKNFNAAGIEDCEKIIESHDNMSQILVGKYHNEFIAVQRMLSFGPECIILEPASIKQKVIDKLLAMREIYKNEKRSY